MSDSFVVASVHGGVRLEFGGPIPRDFREGDSCTYRVVLSGGPVQACVDVYDELPLGWTRLFQEMATRWRGWDGPLEHSSLEGHVSLSCTARHTGQVQLRVELSGDPGGSDWQAANTLQLEAGQLEALAMRAKDHFG